MACRQENAVSREASPRMNIGTLLRNGIVLSDGGCVFELERRGYIQAGPYTPEVAVEFPEALLQLHTEFRRAGAEVIQALTFYGTGDKVGDDADRINRAAVRMARQAAQGALVAGGLSPTPTFRESKPGTLDLMRRHLEAQVQEGVDFVIGETFCWLEEALLAVQAVKEAGLYCMLTMNIPPSVAERAIRCRIAPDVWWTRAPTPSASTALSTPPSRYRLPD